MNERLDIEVNLGGFRAAWTASTERAKRWVKLHPSLVLEAPENIEQDSEAVNDLIHHAWSDGLMVGISSDCPIFFHEHPAACSVWVQAEAAA